MGPQDCVPEYALEFSRKPSDRFWQVPLFRNPQKHALKIRAIHHIEIHAVEKVPRSQRGKGVYSVFLVPKKNGDMRAILDLKWLNQFLLKKQFKMETCRSIMVALEKDSYLASTDFSEAYLHIPILVASRHASTKRLHYAYTWKKSCSSCGEKGINASKPKIRHILEFLQDGLEKELKYSQTSALHLEQHPRSHA